MPPDLPLPQNSRSHATSVPALAIGLMSGTSQDGVDVALIETDGEIIARFGPTAYRTYSKKERALLRSATAAAANLTDRTARPAALAAAETIVNDAHAEAVETVPRRQWNKTRGRHRRRFPRANGTAPAAAPSHACNSATERRLRRGSAFRWSMTFAPPTLKPAGRGRRWRRFFTARWWRRLAGKCRLPCSTSAASPTSLTSTASDLIACDTGPGNALLDDFLRVRTGQLLDTDGRIAAAGRPDENAIAQFLAHSYFSKPPPKSLDRNEFRRAAGAVLNNSSGIEAGAATLTALTAAAVARVVPLLPRPPKTWIVSGGGARNPTLMRMLGERLAPARVESAHEAGWSVDSLEAQAVAYLAVRSLRRLPITFPGTTGVSEPLSGGVFANPSSGTDING